MTLPPILTGPVRIVGTGLLGTSLGLACRRAGLDVQLADISAENLRTASGLGAGHAARPGDRAAAGRRRGPARPPRGRPCSPSWSPSDAVVTDVGSVKTGPLAEVAAGATPDQLARYVGGHPMAGSERSGPLAATRRRSSTAARGP